MNHFIGRRVVVTGAGGSIGSQICRQLVQMGVDELTLVGLTEGKLYDIDRELRGMNTGTWIEPVLGSVCNATLMHDTLRGKDYVIHAGAHKHVPLCEQNPVEAIQNNVFGTKTLLDAAVAQEVSQFLFVSTDKAVRPKSIMGATKRVCEMMVARAADKWPDGDFLTVRFGNVLHSSGSVLPLWREQIQKGGPITLTDKRCTRYFMSISEASELVLTTMAMGYQQGTFVFDMGPPKNLYDMALAMVVDSGMECEISITGLRPGEKLTEELDYGGARLNTQHPKIFEVEGDTPAVKLVDLGQLEQYVKTGLDRRAVDMLMEIVA